MTADDDLAILKQVRDYADHAHGEQKRKYTGDRYIVHPVRVMELCKSHTQDLCVLSAALLHDVLEDTPVTEKDIRSFLADLMPAAEVDKTVRLVVELTDVYVHEKFPHLNRRSRKEMERTRMSRTSVDAQTIKYADIIDNCREIVSHDRHFARIFLKECDALLKVMLSGNKALFDQARKDVSAGLSSLNGR